MQSSCYQIKLLTWRRTFQDREEEKKSAPAVGPVIVASISEGTRPLVSSQQCSAHVIAGKVTDVLRGAAC